MHLPLKFESHLKSVLCFTCFRNLVLGCASFAIVTGYKSGELYFLLHTYCFSGGNLNFFFGYIDLRYTLVEFPVCPIFFSLSGYGRR